MLQKLSSKTVLLSLAISYCFLTLYFGSRDFFLNYYFASDIQLQNGMIIGGDFPIFYIAGKLFLENRTHLYDYAFQLEQLRAMFVGTPHSQVFLVFIYPPFVAAFLSLIVKTSLYYSYLTWLSISVFLFLASTSIVIQPLGKYRLKKFFLFLCGISFIPFLYNCLGGGQMAVLGLLVLSLCLHFRRTGNDWLEGFALGLGLYKPPLFLFMGLLAIIEKRWRVVFGAFVSVFGLIILSLLFVGRQQLIEYFFLAANYRYDHELANGVALPPHRGVGLYALLNRTIYDAELSMLAYLLILSILLAAMLLIKRKYLDLKHASVDMTFAAESSLTVFLSVQCMNYDLTLLLPAIYIVLINISSNTPSVLRVLLAFTLFLLHIEWIFRTSYNGLEYSPTIPFILTAWSLLLIASIYQVQLERSNRQT